MDKQNYVVVVVVVAIAVVVIVGLLMYYMQKHCPVVQVYPSCPNIPSSQYTDTPTGVCLLDCDQYSDACYRKCNSNEDCIRRCYQTKANCYMSCLGNQQEKFTSGGMCGCSV